MHASGKYILLLSKTISNAGQGTQWTWSNVQDPDGIVWDFQGNHSSFHFSVTLPLPPKIQPASNNVCVVVGGNCGQIQYQNSAQASRDWVSLDQTRQQSTFTCDFGTHTGHCLEFESSSWDDDTCASGSNPPFCDYRARCDPFYPGDPATCC
jgi:hypothetical protein